LVAVGILYCLHSVPSLLSLVPLKVGVERMWGRDGSQTA
jgi:hypothetical protein